MKITRESFFKMGQSLELGEAKLEQFWQGLENCEESHPFSKYLFYLGSLIIILSMTWLMNRGWEVFGGGGLFLIATGYAVAFLAAGHFLWNKSELRIPAGLFTTIAVAMVPLALYGLESYLGLFEKGTTYQSFFSIIDPKWVAIEIATILVSLVVLYFYPFAFTLVALFLAGWFLIMDLFIGRDINRWELGSWITAGYGLFYQILGYYFDRKRDYDFGFWAYLLGTFALFLGITQLMFDERGEFIWFLFLLGSLVLSILSIVLQRVVLMIFGAFGIFLYLSHLAFFLFKDSVLFPFILTLIGLAIVGLGILYQRNISTIRDKFNTFLK